MNPLLAKHYTYVVFEPVGSVQSQLMSITKAPWYDIAINLAGQVSNDNSFKLYAKFSLGVEVFNVVQTIAILTGRLTANEEEQTIMHVEVRPNYFVLFVFYLLVATFLLKLLMLFVSQEKDWIEATLLFLLLILFRSVIHFSMGRLRNRFERTMLIKPEE